MLRVGGCVDILHQDGFAAFQYLPGNALAGANVFLFRIVGNRTVVGYQFERQLGSLRFSSSDPSLPRKEVMPASRLSQLPDWGGLSCLLMGSV